MTEEVIKLDNDPKRATFKTQYPLISSKKVLESSNDFKELTEKSHYFLESLTIEFNYFIANNKICTFSKCQFFIEKGNPNLIKQITFKSCNFDYCFLGSVNYINVRFENCSFKNCDFSNSRFEYCVFDQCTFEKCSASHPEFISTEISPGFVTSLVLLSENYEKGKLTNDIKDSFYSMKFNVAKKVYNSNNSIDSHTLADLSLFELKKAEHTYLKRLTLKEFVNKRYLKGFRMGLYLPSKWFNLKLTKGGTSLSRLLWCICAIIILANFYFCNSSIIDKSYIFTSSPNFIIKYFEWLPRTASIFLAYGYTAYTSNDFIEYFLLNLFVVIGLFMYALLISVLMRKIYK